MLYKNYKKVVEYFANGSSLAYENHILLNTLHEKLSTKIYKKIEEQLQECLKMLPTINIIY